MAAMAMEQAKDEPANGQPAKGFELQITRVFDAPLDLVWRAWTEPQMLVEWMGPRGFECVEYLPGRKAGDPWHMVMRGDHPKAEGKALMGQFGRILEMEPPRLLRYTFRWRKITELGWPESHFNESIVTVAFEEKWGKTMMTFTQGPLATEEQCQGHTGGWNSTFDRFAEFMLAQQPLRVPDPTKPPTELHLRRFFKAPRELVWAAWTTPEMVAEWFAPRGFSLSVTRWEAAKSGMIDAVMEGHGMRHRMVGRFVEVFAPYRMHFTIEVPDEQGKAMFENWNSVFLEEKDGGTELTLDVHVMMHTEEALKFLAGMAQGWQQTLDRLGEMLAGRS